MSFTDEDLKEFQKHINEFSQCSELQEMFPHLLARLDAAEDALTSCKVLRYDGGLMIVGEPYVEKYEAWLRAKGKGR